MVDVGRDYGTSGGYLVADKFGGDVSVDSKLTVVHVLADSHIFHFGGYDTCFSVSHLRYTLARLRLIWLHQVREADFIERLVGKTFATIFRGDVFELLHVAAVSNPLLAQARNTPVDIHFHVGVGERSAGVVNAYRGILGDDSVIVVVESHCRSERDFSHTHLDWEKSSRNVDFFRSGIRFHVDIIDFHK